MRAHDHAGEQARYGICLTCADADPDAARQPPPAEQLQLPDGLDFDGGGLDPRDHVRLGDQAQRVLDLLADGRWRTLSEIARATGDPEASVSARLRDLRKPKFGGYEVARRLRNEALPGLYEYRLERTQT